MSSKEIVLSGHDLTIEEVIEIGSGGCIVRLSEDARERMQITRSAIDSILESGGVVYGVNTGFGALSSVRIDNDEVAKLQENLIRSHACGVGENMKPEHVLMMMVIRANSLAIGNSGIRPEIVDVILQFVNARICPIIPRIGSLGASGDLAPLSHLALGLIGESDFQEEYGQGWNTITSDTAFTKIGNNPVELQAKEGLSLINGTSQMCTFLCQAITDLDNLLYNANVAVSCTVEAIKGSHKPFDSRIHDSRPHLGQQHCAKQIRLLLQNSEINQSHIDCDRVQDPYSIRCAPQVHGPVYELLNNAKSLLSIEFNYVTDNPLVFINDDGSPEVISGGNFHGQNLAIVADNLAICYHELGSISERRTNLLLSPNWSGQNAFLANSEGVESGLMILQYVSAACLSELHLVANPVTTSNVPVSMEKEDHVSMGATATFRLLEAGFNLSTILSNELICGLVCLRNISQKPSQGVQIVKGKLDTIVPQIDTDMSLSHVTELVAKELISTKL